MQRSLLPLTLAAIAAAGGVRAQSDLCVSGLSTAIADCDAATTYALNLGVQFLNGETYVSAVAGTAANDAKDIFVFNGNTLVRSFSQPASVVAAAGFGLRDGATDGTILFFANELGIFAFDGNGAPVTSYNANNGPQSPTLPITGPALATIGTYRALAYDPAGDSGNGSFFVGDFGDDILEIDQGGNVLNTLVNGGQWSAYGLAYDAARDTLWVNDGGDGTNLIEIDANTGVATGNVAPTTNGAPGGLSRGPGNTLFALTQAAPDIVEVATIPPFTADPLQLVTSIDSGTLDTSAKLINPGTTSAEFSTTGTPGSTAVVFFINAGNEANQCGSVGGLPPVISNSIYNFTRLTNFTSPMGAFLDVTGTAGTPISVPTASLVGVLPDGDLRLQAIYVDPTRQGRGLPLRASNEVKFTVGSAQNVGVVVAADGGNSFNSNTASGYWSITNNSTDPNKAIVSVTLDMSGIAQVFDLDQTGMADAFWNGNATSAGCLGTYRNGSDATCGLDYTAPEINIVNTACSANPGENSGVESLGAALASQSLTWRFTGGTFLNGAVFEFDIDTDGGGITGDAHAGTNVVVEFADGTLGLGSLAVVPSTQRAEANF